MAAVDGQSQSAAATAAAAELRQMSSSQDPDYSRLSNFASEERRVNM